MNSNTIKMRIYRWGPVILWMGLIFFLSAQSSLPDIPGLDELEYGDKFQHALAYAILGSLIWRALSRDAPKWWQIGATIALATAYGLSDESHQMYVPGRTFDLLDLTADAVGSAIAATLLTFLLGGDEIGGRTTGREDLRSKGQETRQP